MRTIKLSVLLLLSTLLAAATLFAEDRVLDLAGLLSDAQVQELERRIETIAAQYNFDIVIVTEEYIGNTDINDSAIYVFDDDDDDSDPYVSVDAYADDLFDYSGYGLGEGKDGVLLLQVTETRDYAFTVHGKGPMGGETVFTDWAQELAEKHLVEKLKADDYYGAYMGFIDDTAKYLAVRASGRHFTRFYTGALSFSLIAWIVSFIVAFLVVSIWKRGMNTAKSSGQAAPYIVSGSLQFVESSDKFLFSTVTKTARPKDTGSSSSGRSRTSSSGRSHSGRSGKY
ncbi:TPM domain-containing protein [Leadbettera azotonutricia]|uniref:TPM domain-containing protein n=1 Tax=Leadbettera azotonutricia (strain ATCC BAA-888 / DSM 13862 / ZAS-9) TaxID=545695 RepID=F5Y8K9_LEAAZ|nr:TPM domain-containing protein [Leadbettera azotonutricia]AEF82734.1 conserved hypothetical protein [Leadbettera azotonutricia ZAS-9]